MTLVSKPRGGIDAPFRPTTPEELSTATQEARIARNREAIKLARAAKTRGKELKAELKTLGRMEGRAVVADVIENRLDEYGHLRAIVLISSITETGPVKATNICRRVGINERFRLDVLTDPERVRLVAMLREGGRK